MLPLTIENEPRTGEGKAQLAASCVRDQKSGDMIVKIVSRSDRKLSLQLEGLPTANQVTRIELSGEPDAENRFGEEASVTSKTQTMAFDPAKAVEVPPHSLTILRFAAR
jgi:alpha-L-arabinofuranosidase